MDSMPRSQHSTVAGAAGAPGDQPSGYSSKLVSAQNECVQVIPMPLNRTEELPTELNWLLGAALANRLRVAFDVEPASFFVSLSHLSKGKA
jgi:hypothetical protein